MLATGAGYFYCVPSFAGEIAEFQFALNAYDSGDYKTAIGRFNKLLDHEITNKALLVEVYKYLGASYMFTGKIKAARKQFKKLLLKDPDYELDPVLFPTEVLDEYWKVKKDLEDELQKVAESKKQQQKELEEKKKELKESWKKLVQTANHPPYIKQNIKKSHLFFAFAPFGIGQFQNGHKIKGYLFLSGEAALLIAAVTTYWMTVYYDNSACNVGNNKKAQYSRFKSIADGLSIANKVTFWMFIGAIVAGIVDAIIFFKKRRVTYETVKESDIPPEYRVKPVDIPVLDLDDIIGETKEDERP